MSLGCTNATKMAAGTGTRFFVGETGALSSELVQGRVDAVDLEDMVDAFVDELRHGRRFAERFRQLEMALSS